MVKKMNKQKKWKDLYDKYPDMFVNKHKSPMESCMSFGIECDLGWYDILSSLCWLIQQHENNISSHIKYLEKNNPEKLKEEQEYFSVRFDQIKEKFGGLRVYFSGGDEYVEGLVDMAESFSYKICEFCGERGNPNKEGWIITLCESCRHNRKRK